MARKPIVFAMANPDPEIDYEHATSAREDIIMATGRSDLPQPGETMYWASPSYSGAPWMYVRRRSMRPLKLAAVKALADLAKTPVPDIVNMAYNEKNILFGPTYIIPKPLDPRLLSTVPRPSPGRRSRAGGLKPRSITGRPMASNSTTGWVWITN